MKVFHKWRGAAAGQWDSVEDLTTAMIDRNTHDNTRGEGYGALERAEEKANQCARVLGGLLEHLTQRGVLSPEELGEILGAEILNTTLKRE